MENLHQIVTHMLESKSWPSMPVDGDANTLALRYQGENGIWSCGLLINNEPKNLRFFSYCPEIASEKSEMAVLKFLSRLNWGLPDGCFSMNPETREVEYRTTLDLEVIPATEAAIWRMILVNVATMDQFLDTLLEVIRTNDEELQDPDSPR